LPDGFINKAFFYLRENNNIHLLTSFISDIIRILITIISPHIMNIGFQLFQLQRIDTGLDIAQQRINEIDNLINNDTKTTNAQNNIEKEKTQLLTYNNEFNAISNDIQTKKIKVSQSESSLYNGSVTNPKELQDLQLEISSIKKSIEKLEEVLFEVMIHVDQSEKHLEIQKEILINTKSKFATFVSLLHGEKNTLLENIKGLNSKKATMIAQISEDNLNQYETLRNLKNGLAVTKLQENTCGACGSSLTASQRQEARSATNLFICPSCRRIIYGSS